MGWRYRFPFAAELPTLPRRPLSLPRIEVDAVAHRIDLQMARMKLAALAKIARSHGSHPFRHAFGRRRYRPKNARPGHTGVPRAWLRRSVPNSDLDGGEVRVRQAAETYNQAFNLLTEKAVNVRSEARDAFRVYRSTYDIAEHYQREVLPLRKIISDEMQLRFSSMQVDVFALLVEARQRIAAMRPPSKPSATSGWRSPT